MSPHPIGPAPTSSPSDPIMAKRKRPILHAGWVLLLGVVVVGWFLREPLRQRMLEKTSLTARAPAADVVEEIIRGASDPAQAIVTAWESGHIVPRSVALRELSRQLTAYNPLPPRLEALVLSAAVDPDTSMRETALSILSRVQHPKFGAAIAAQLQNADPEVRLLGLQQLKGFPAATGVPLVARQLDSEDPRVIGLALNLLGRWSGENFGVRLSDTVPVNSVINGVPEFSQQSVDIAAAGALRAKQWWAAHQSEYSAAPLDPLPTAPDSTPVLPAGDFELMSVDGRKVRLSDFRGKRVVVNFWTTWCSACVGEIPTLVALQKAHPDDLVVLGISLDGVPDEHGHVGGHEAEPSGEDHDTAPTLAKLRAEVAKVAKKRGITYPVLLDAQNTVGSRFNGGELPSTLLVDRQGQIQRRFIGARPQAVLEAMVAELAVLPTEMAKGR